jgi:asparagine synthase (glutamine-hydrolysing)
MSEIAGLVRFDGDAIAEVDASRLARSVLSRRPPSVWRPDPATILVEGRDSLESMREQPHPDQFTVADAWLDSPGEVAAALGLERVPGDRELCAHACARWGGEHAAERLSGDFAFAHWERSARRLTLGRDAIGVVPLYYLVTPRLILFATSLQTMLAMPDTPRDLDEVSLAHLMAIALQDQERTLYRHIRRVPPGGVAVLERGECRTRRWFTLDSIAPVRFARDDDYVEAARAELDRAVACRLPKGGAVASELSGGFDSAGVTATAARLLGDKRLPVFTRLPAHAAPGAGLDERALAGLLVARHSNIDWRIVDDVREAPRDTHSEGEAAATLLPRTSGHNASWFESMALQIEAAGIKVVLKGNCGNSTLSFTGAPAIGDGLRRGRIAGAVRDLKGLARLRGHPLRRVVASQIYHAWVPRGVERWREQRRSGTMPWLAYSMLSPGFLAEVDYAAEAAAVGHDVPFRLPYESREQRLRLMQAQYGRDFRGYARRKGSYEDRDPYCDRRMVEFCLGIPDDQYWRDGQGRWLARRVLADRVPAETLAQTVRARQAPEWYSLASARRDAMAEAIDRIERSPLASRVLDVPRMRALLDDWPADADAAERTMTLHGYALPRAIAMGGFLRWHEGRND